MEGRLSPGEVLALQAQAVNGKATHWKHQRNCGLRPSGASHPNPRGAFTEAMRAGARQQAIDWRGDNG